MELVGVSLESDSGRGTPFLSHSTLSTGWPENSIWRERSCPDWEMERGVRGPVIAAGSV